MRTDYQRYQVAMQECQAKKCMSAQANADLKKLYMDCYMEGSPDKKKACQDNLQQVASTGTGLEGDLKQSGNALTSNAKQGAIVSEAGATIAVLLAITGNQICASGGILALGSAYALYNEITHSKEIKKRMEHLQAEYQAKVATIDRNTYEYQRLSFEYAIRGYEEMAKAYDEKAKNYKIIMGVGGITAAVAAVEITIATVSLSTVPCNMGLATLNLAAGALMFAKASSLKNQATSAAADHRDKASQLKKLLAEFDKFHTNDGIIDGVEAMANVISYVDSAAQSSSAIVKKTTGVSADKVGSSNSTGQNCIGNNGKVDTGCGCKSKNSCMSVGLNFKFSGTSAQIADQKAMITNLDSNAAVGHLASSFSALAAGRKSLKDFRSENLTASNSRIKAGLNAIDNFNKTAKEKGFDPVSLSSGTKNAIAANSKFAKAKAELPPSGSSQGNHSKSKKKAKNSKNTAIAGMKGNWKNPLSFKKGKILGELDYLIGDEVDNVIGNSALEQEISKNKSKEESGLLAQNNKDQLSGNFKNSDQVIQNREFDIFTAISIRYRKKFFRKAK